MSRNHSKIRNKIWIVLMILVCPFLGYAQANGISEDALKILDKAFAPVTESEVYGISFESIAYGLKNPAEIFSLPGYKIHKGGYLYVNKNKYELKLPHVKAISNGVLSLMTDEQNKVLYIDSVRSMNESHEDKEKEFTDLFNTNFRNQKLKIEKEEMMSGEKCSRISSSMEISDTSVEVIYWVAKSSGKLIMYAENSGSGYTVYFIKNIGKAPANHKYEFYFPREEQQKLMGYKVFDFRYIKE